MSVKLLQMKFLSLRVMTTKRLYLSQRSLRFLQNKSKQMLKTKRAKITRWMKMKMLLLTRNRNQKQSKMKTKIKIKANLKVKSKMKKIVTSTKCHRKMLLWKKTKILSKKNHLKIKMKLSNMQMMAKMSLKMLWTLLKIVEMQKMVLIMRSRETTVYEVKLL